MAKLGPSETSLIKEKGLLMAKTQTGGDRGASLHGRLHLFEVLMYSLLTHRSGAGADAISMCESPATMAATLRTHPVTQAARGLYAAHLAKKGCGWHM
eukprot:scaffold236065_cov21-Tisochrysis_lutea.AAC.1